MSSAQGAKSLCHHCIIAQPVSAHSHCIAREASSGGFLHATVGGLRVSELQQVQSLTLWEATTPSFLGSLSPVRVLLQDGGFDNSFLLRRGTHQLLV